MTTESLATARCCDTLTNISHIGSTYLVIRLYEFHPFLVSTYKKPQGSSISREQEMFNTALSKPSIESEQAIGIWKGRFPWLHSIPMIMKQSTQEEDLSHILEVMDTCIILHNVLIEQNEDIPNDWMDDEASDVNDALSETDKLNQPIGEAEPNDQRHKQLNHYINENYVYKRNM